MGVRPRQPPPTTDARIDRDEWPETWCAQGSAWPVMGKMYPQIQDEFYYWLNLALLKPKILLRHAHHLVFQE